MMDSERSLTYFVADVHLGLNVKSPEDRERRFVGFLRSIPASETESLYLLGDIWDFWYEYRDVVPKGYVKVFSAIQDLIDAGVNVYFFPGNHDVWTYGYFEELGMKKLCQPYLVEIGGKDFCLGHGDGLGRIPFGFRILRGAFHSRVLQFLFSLLHPWVAFRIGKSWSKENRLARRKEYVYKGASEPLTEFAEDFSRSHHVDYFIFGHYHTSVRMKLSTGSEFYILKDWMDSSPYLYFDGMSISGGYFQKSE